MSKAHAMMQLGGGDKKNDLDIVKNEINSVKNFDDLKKLGETIKTVSKLEKRDVEDLLSLKFLQSKMLPPLVALCLVIPSNKAPKPLNNLIQKVINDFNSLSKIIQNGIAYKYVDTAIIINEEQRLYEEGLLASLFSDNPAYFAGPYLYLLASLKIPKDIFESNSLTYTKNARIDAMTLYYYGEVLLLSNNYEKSEKNLLRAYKIAKAAKINDLIEHIVDYLSLASFLNHVPFEVFCKYIKYTHEPKSFALNIWDLDHPGYINKINDKWEFFSYFQEEILKEHTRRVIFDFAATTSVMTIQSLIDACCYPKVEEVLKSLKSSGELKFKIQDDNIKFIRHHYQKQIDCEQEKIDTLLETIKPKETQ